MYIIWTFSLELTLGKVCVHVCALAMRIKTLGSIRAVDSAKTLRVHEATHKVGCERDISQRAVYTHPAPSNLTVVQNHLQLSPVMGSLGVDARCPVPIEQWRQTVKVGLMLKFSRCSKSRSTSSHPSSVGRPAARTSLAFVS